MKAMILAAGLGTRMRPLTDSCPKPLLPVAGKPLIQHHIEKLAAAGFKDLVINTSHLAEQIEAALGDGSALGVNIQFSREAQPLETAGGILQALPLLQAAGQGKASADTPFLVINGDIWTDIDLSVLNIESNTETILGGQGVEPALAHLLLVPNPAHHPEGDFYLNEGRVLASLDGDLALPAAERLTFSGISVLHPQLFDGLEPDKHALGPLLRQAMVAGRVTGAKLSGEWIDVGTPERLEQVRAKLAHLN